MLQFWSEDFASGYAKLQFPGISTEPKHGLSGRSFFKAEFPQVAILFGTQFPSLGIFISKKIKFWKN